MGTVAAGCAPRGLLSCPVIVIELPPVASNTRPSREPPPRAAVLFAMLFAVPPPRVPGLSRTGVNTAPATRSNPLFSSSRT